MSQITSQLLREMVGIKAGRPLIDKLVEPLNLVLPAYGITTEFRIAAFLATAAPESDWFKTLREYGHGAGRKYGKPDAITGLVYYGRGIFQNTWKRGYQAFTEYVADNWESIKPRAAKFHWTVPPDFVSEPDMLATPYWAVEAACWYWKANGLAKYADRGLTGFFGLQGLVNRGDAGKRALQYDDRLASYERARRIIADDFELTSAATPAERPTVTEKPVNTPSGLPSDGSPVVGPPPNNDGVVVEKEETPGFFTKIKAKLAAWFSGFGGLTALQQYKEQIDALGLPGWIILWAMAGAFVIFLGWLAYEAYDHLRSKDLKRLLTVTLINANSTATNMVVTACKEDLDKFAAAGWTVVTRQ
jgi:predicted chitinase